MSWISVGAPFETPPEAAPRDEVFFSVIRDLPHAEERRKGASRSPQDRSASISSTNLAALALVPVIRAFARSPIDGLARYRRNIYGDHGDSGLVHDHIGWPYRMNGLELFADGRRAFSCRGRAL